MRSATDKTASLLRHRTMQAKSILNGSSFSPFIFHSKFISHRAKNFGMCGENYCGSVDADESKAAWKETWKFCFRLDNANNKIWSLNSFYDHHPVTCF